MKPKTKLFGVFAIFCLSLFFVLSVCETASARAGGGGSYSSSSGGGGSYSSSSGGSHYSSSDDDHDATLMPYVVIMVLVWAAIFAIGSWLNEKYPAIAKKYWAVVKIACILFEAAISAIYWLLAALALLATLFIDIVLLPLTILAVLFNAVSRHRFEYSRLITCTYKLSRALYKVFKSLLKIIHDALYGYAEESSSTEPLIHEMSKKNVRIIEKIKKANPNFNIDVFKSRIKNAFLKIQKGWCERDLTPAEAFLSDGTYEQFSLQIADFKKRHVIDFMRDLEVSNIEIIGFYMEGEFQTAHVAITASAINYLTDEKTGEKINESGSGSSEEFTEVWSLVKRLTNKPSNEKGLIEGVCPNCGNPLETGRIAKCTACGSLLRSGEYDWVLSKITQLCEYRNSSKTQRHIAAAYKNEDPGFSIIGLEDKATVMFWRYVAACRNKDIRFLNKAAAKSFCDEVEGSWQKSRTYFTLEIGLASVDLECISKQNDETIALIAITYGGKSETETENGITQNQYRNFSQFMVLKRQSNVKTKIENTLSSAHCPNCGAPELSLESSSCPYCGAVFNSADNNWVLDGIIAKNSKRANEIKMQQINVELPANNNNNKIEAQASGKEMFRYFIAMVLADNVISAEEEKTLAKLAERFKIKQSDCELIYNEIKSQPKPVEYVLETTTIINSSALTDALKELACSDGKVSAEEQNLLNKISHTGASNAQTCS